MPLTYLSPIHKATRQIGDYLAPRCAEAGVGNPEGHLLTYLLGYSPCAISDLHRVFGLRRSTLTSMLDRLEERSLIQRRLDPTDRRSFQVYLTPDGHRTADRLRKVLEDFEARISQSVSPAEREGFAAVMAAIDGVTRAPAGTHALTSEETRP